MSDEPIRCGDCRFYSNDRCLRDEAKSYTPTGEPRWDRAADMRRWPGPCGNDAKLFEPRPRLTWVQITSRVCTVLGILAMITACCIAVTPR